jgi:hypothetical protein
MRIDLKRGLLRAWVVIAVAWIGLTGWSTQWGFVPFGFHLGGECWDRLAKWPDGQSFTEWEVFDEVDTPSNVEINKKRGAWAAESIPERSRWAEVTRQKLIDCEATAPLKRRLLKVSDIWSSLQGSLPLIFLPPFALLIAGYIIGWVAQGFRARA